MNVILRLIVFLDRVVLRFHRDPLNAITIINANACIFKHLISQRGLPSFGNETLPVISAARTRTRLNTTYLSSAHTVTPPRGSKTWRGGNIGKVRNHALDAYASGLCVIRPGLGWSSLYRKRSGLRVWFRYFTLLEFHFPPNEEEAINRSWGS
jgi:hypothetical protein